MLCLLGGGGEGRSAELTVTYIPLREKGGELKIHLFPFRCLNDHVTVDVFERSVWEVRRGERLWRIVPWNCSVAWPCCVRKEVQ